MSKQNLNSEANLDRRSNGRRKTGDDRRKASAIVAVERRAGQRREKVQRRRQIDPTTCERDYDGNEIEFMHALDAYKRASGRMFPTCSEILEVLRGLGYQKMSTVVAHTSEPLPPAVETVEELAELTDEDNDDFELLA